MERNLRFLHTYLYIVLFIGLVGLADALLTFLKITFPIYVKIVTLVLFLFFFINIFSIAVFRRHRLEKIVYIIPIYHITSYVLFLSLGLYLTILVIIPPWLSVALICLQIVSSIFELSFSIYLLKKFDFQVSQTQ